MVEDVFHQIEVLAHRYLPVSRKMGKFSPGGNRQAGVINPSPAASMRAATKRPEAFSPGLKRRNGSETSVRPAHAAKVIVEAEHNRLHLLFYALRGRAEGNPGVEGHGLGAEVIVVVLEQRRPIVEECTFDPAAERPAGAPVTRRRRADRELIEKGSAPR